MSLLSSAAKLSNASEGPSNTVKIKRKSRRHRTIPGSEEPEQAAPRERNRKEPRDVPEGPKLNTKRRSSNVKGEGTSRRTPSHSSHRNPYGTPSLHVVSRRRSEQPTLPHEVTISRRSLTTSASSLRPSNRKRIDESPYSTKVRRNSGNNNNPEVEEGNHHFAARILPSRASKYRNLSAGATKKHRTRPTAAPASIELPDRPPSRQRHAFPTHLIDANAFDAPETTRRCGGSSTSCSSSTTRSSSARSRLSPVDFTRPEDVKDRPPSRYMIKAKRNSKQTVSEDLNTLSRRGVVDKNITFSCNHDPKTDGFADVDESVPPPFEIKVTTDTGETELTTKNPLSARHWPFSNQDQLQEMAGSVRGSDSCRGSDQGMTDFQSQLQWFGNDDQINNAHLFETVITMPSPRPILEPEVIAIEDGLEESDGLEFQSRKVVTNQPQSDQHEENPFPSRRATTAAKTTSIVLDQTAQWIRSSTNPFFVEPSSDVDYDSMDPETAIEQTPLYTSEDFMNITATEMTDLHLDDYTAASIPAPTPSPEGWSSRVLSASSPQLRTSLGKDFLSLFAQH